MWVSLRRRSWAGKDALNGFQGPLVFNLTLHVGDDLADLDEIDRLLDKELHPGGVCLGDHLLGGHLGDHDEFSPAAPLLQLPDDLNAVLAGHEQVNENQVGVQGQNLVQIGRAVAGVSAETAQAAALHDVLQNADDRDVVLNDEYFHVVPLL